LLRISAATESRDLEAQELTHHVIGPSIGKFDPFDGRDDVDSHWRHADLEDRSAVCELLRGNLMERGSEGGQCLKNSSRVLKRGIDPDVEIFRSAQVSLQGESVRSHDQEFNLGGEQFG
jgi:hypothetical protein